MDNNFSITKAVKCEGPLCCKQECVNNMLILVTGLMFNPVHNTVLFMVFNVV